jgi:hypothetical protein
VQTASNYEISNPYENVDWAIYGQYKAAHHTHSTYSDGSNTREAMIVDKYNRGFDIVAMTDHDYSTSDWTNGIRASNGGWNNMMRTPLTADVSNSINNGTFTNIPIGNFSGTRQQSNGMIGISNSNELSARGQASLNHLGPNVNFSNHHINAFWAENLPSNAGTGRSIEQILELVEGLGGITHINHPGRYTGGQNINLEIGAERSSNPAVVDVYTDLFMRFSSCVGMEIVNKLDNESRTERILWDNILMQTMPQGRAVWGFANDDSHSLNGSGFAWNVMLMPELTELATRTSMETGAFYSVSRIDRMEGINTTLLNGSVMPGASSQTTTNATMYSGDDRMLYLLEQSTPSISNIVVNGDIIAIEGADYDMIEWIADGKKIATGNTINLNDYSGLIGSYVRAQLKSTTGIAYTQPFGVELQPQTVPTLTTTIFAEDFRESINIRFFLDGISAELAIEDIVLIADGETVENIRDYALNIANWQTSASAIFISKTKTPWSEMVVQITSNGQTLTYEYINNK